jgi:hypothetical protein
MWTNPSSSLRVLALFYLHWKGVAEGHLKGKICTNGHIHGSVYNEKGYVHNLKAVAKLVPAYSNSIMSGKGSEIFIYTQILAKDVYRTRAVASTILTKEPKEFPIPSKISGSQKSMGSPKRRTQTGAARNCSCSGL